MTDTRPRGIRNNNPGNLDYHDGATWRGLANPPYELREDGSRGRFCAFKTPFFGLRALCKVLLTYQSKHGLRTIRQMIERWAPTTENDTDAYVKRVAKHIGLPADMKIVFDRAVLALMAQAIARHENGGEFYDVALYVQAADAALNGG